MKIYDATDILNELKEKNLLEYGKFIPGDVVDQITMVLKPGLTIKLSSLSTSFQKDILLDGCCYLLFYQHFACAFRRSMKERATVRKGLHYVDTVTVSDSNGDVIFRKSMSIGRGNEQNDDPTR